jgi:hypothetical protein
MGPHTYECIKSKIPLDILSFLNKDPLTFFPRMFWVGIPPIDLAFKGSNHACRKCPFQRPLLFPILPT